jgi:hypothetical protein
VADDDRAKRVARIEDEEHFLASGGILVEVSWRDGFEGYRWERARFVAFEVD